jgi:cobalamin biosynthesis protein CobW
MGAAGLTVDIITGFLGSGKTTLLKQVLSRGMGDKKVAIIVNEIGEIGIDGRQIECMNVEQMIELENGCICCTVNYQFGLAVRSIIETVNPHLLIIETTGLADPYPLADEIRNTGLRLDAVITVVDAPNVLGQLKEATVVRDQIEAADFLVMNKTDLVQPRELKKIERRVRRLNRRALMLETTYGALDADVLFATSAGSHRERLDRARAAAACRDASCGDPGHEHAGGTPSPSARTSDHLATDAIAAFSFESHVPFDRPRFEKMLRKLPASVYRAKGMVQFAGESWPSLFNFTCGRYDFDWCPLPSGDAFRSQGVFIGKEIRRSQDDILRQLERCKAEP